MTTANAVDAARVELLLADAEVAFASRSKIKTHCAQDANKSNLLAESRRADERPRTPPKIRTDPALSPRGHSRTFEMEIVPCATDAAG